LEVVEEGVETVLVHGDRGDDDVAREPPCHGTGRGPSSLVEGVQELVGRPWSYDFDPGVAWVEASVDGESEQCAEADPDTVGADALGGDEPGDRPGEGQEEDDGFDGGDGCCGGVAALGGDRDAEGP